MNNKIQSVIILGRKNGFCRAVKYLLSRKIRIIHIVTDEMTYPKIKQIIKNYSIPLSVTDEEIYEKIKHKLLKIPDLVISYLYWKKIRMPLIQLGQKGCINFHPAPLPEYKGRAGYNTAILDNKDYFGVSAHFIDSEEYDSGPIICVKHFPIDRLHENAHSLERKSQKQLLLIFKHVVSLYLTNSRIPSLPNIGGTILTKKELEDLKLVHADESSSTIKRKIRAFFFPPYAGATIEIQGNRYTLVDEEILDYLNRLIK